MRSQIARVLLYGLLAVASACVPILPHDEYVPAMDGAKILVDRCWGTQKVEYQTGGITLTSRISKWPQDLLKLELQFDVPEGSTVELLSPDVTIKSASANNVRHTRIPGISLTGNPALPLEPIVPMVGRDIVIYGARSPRHFWLFAPLNDVVSDDMRVVLPMLKINGRVVEIPEIKFTRQVRIQLIAPIQC